METRLPWDRILYRAYMYCLLISLLKNINYLATAVSSSIGSPQRFCCFDLFSLSTSYIDTRFSPPTTTLASKHQQQYQPASAHIAPTSFSCPSPAHLFRRPTAPTVWQAFSVEAVVVGYREPRPLERFRQSWPPENSTHGGIKTITATREDRQSEHDAQKTRTKKITSLALPITRPSLLLSL